MSCNYTSNEYNCPIKSFTEETLFMKGDSYCVLVSSDPGASHLQCPPWPQSVGLTYVGRAQQGCRVRSGSLPNPTPSPLSTLVSPWGAAPLTAKDVISDYHRLWERITKGTAGTILLPEDVEGQGIPIGLGPPRVRPRGPLWPW